MHGYFSVTCASTSIIVKTVSITTGTGIATICILTEMTTIIYVCITFIDVWNENTTSAENDIDII